MNKPSGFSLLSILGCATTCEPKDKVCNLQDMIQQKNKMEYQHAFEKPVFEDNEFNDDLEDEDIDDEISDSEYTD